MGYRLVLLGLLFGGLAARWATKPRHRPAAAPPAEPSSGEAADPALNAAEQLMQTQRLGARAGIGAALPEHGQQSKLMPDGAPSAERPETPSPGFSDFPRGA